MVGYIKSAMNKSGEDYRLMILPDHLTPISVRTHSSDPVPFLIYDSAKDNGPGGPLVSGFNEHTAVAPGLHFEEGFRLADYFFLR